MYYAIIQNTQVTTQGTAEEQFVEIETTAHAETLQNIDDILTDDDSVDYSAPKQQLLEPQVQVQNNDQQNSDSDEPNTSMPELITDSSLDTSSIDVIQPNKPLEINLLSNPPQRALPNSPQSPRTNIATPIPDTLLTDVEDTGEQQVPFKPITLTPEHLEHLEPSDQCIIDKCGEVDYVLH